MAAGKSIYGQLAVFQDTGGNLVERIKSLGVYPIFKPLVDLYTKEGEETDHESFNKVLFYILHLYSKESDTLNTNISRAEIKASVMNDLGIEDTKLRQQLMTVSHPAIHETVSRYLDVQGSRAFQHLRMLEDLYHTMLSSAMYIAKDGAIQYDQMRKNAQYAKELYDEIQTWQSLVDEEEKILTDGKKEVRRKSVKGDKNQFTSLRLEDLQQMVRDTQEKPKDE